MKGWLSCLLQTEQNKLLEKNSEMKSTKANKAEDVKEATSKEVDGMASLNIKEESKEATSKVTDGMAGLTIG